MSGFLAVFSEPGRQVTLEEFHDWYDNEHIPLRANHLRSFLSAARYSAADGKLPGWLAVYDIDSVSSFRDPSYTVLREKRSVREAGLIGRLGVLDRRTCEVVRDVRDRGREPGAFVVTLAFEEKLSDEVFEAWMLKSRASRIRVVRVLDKGITGLDGELKEIDVPEYLAILDFECKPEFEVDFPQRVAGSRLWQLYRAYPCIGGEQQVDQA